MYKIDELEIQNLQDGWSAMYIILARSITDSFGERTGEGILREAVRDFGRDLGLSNRQLHLENNIKINLKNLYNYANYLPRDPRFRKNLIRLDEQVKLCDVITCPIASLWDKYGEKKLGSIYCEEFYHAFYKAYLFDKAQVNLSKILTHGFDNHCQFSMYLRPANLDEELRAKCFSEFDSGSEQDYELILEPLEDKERYKQLWLKMYYYILEVASKNYGEKGQLSIALGLQKLAIDSSDFMKKRADMTGNVLDAVYVSKNYPIDIEIEGDYFWDKYYKHDSEEVLIINFNRVFKEQLGF